MELIFCVVHQIVVILFKYLFQFYEDNYNLTLTPRANDIFNRLILNLSIFKIIYSYSLSPKF